MQETHEIDLQCENCEAFDEGMHFDIEGVPICDKCWNCPELWEAPDG